MHTLIRQLNMLRANHSVFSKSKSDRTIKLNTEKIVEIIQYVLFINQLRYHQLQQRAFKSFHTNVKQSSYRL